MITKEFLGMLAMQAGILIRAGFHEFPVPSEWKKDNTPITVSDKGIQALVMHTIRKKYPHVGVIGEEGSHSCDSEWLIYFDPIDGTFPFQSGMPISTFCISLLYQGIPQIAIIYDPFNNRMYTAEKDKGAFLNGTQIFVCNHERLNKETQVHVLWWNFAQFNFAPLLSTLVEMSIPWVNYCSIGIAGAQIAAGHTLAVSIYPGYKVWETAALSLLVEEAGGKCTDIFGNTIDYLKNGKMKGHLITNGLMHDQMLELIAGSL